MTLALKTGFKGNKKMAQGLSTPAALENGQRSVPSTHVGWLTTTCSVTSVPGDPKPSFGLHGFLYSQEHKHTNTISQMESYNRICVLYITGSQPDSHDLFGVTYQIFIRIHKINKIIVMKWQQNFMAEGH